MKICQDFLFDLQKVWADSYFSVTGWPVWLVDSWTGPWSGSVLIRDLMYPLLLCFLSYKAGSTVVGSEFVIHYYRKVA